MVLRTGVVGPRRVRLQRVGQDVRAGGRRHLGRRRQRVERVHHAQRRAQQPARDARLHVLIDDVGYVTAVVSLPVPAVVGTAINGLSAPGTGTPLPTGLLM